MRQKPSGKVVLGQTQLRCRTERSPHPCLQRPLTTVAPALAPRSRSRLVVLFDYLKIRPGPFHRRAGRIEPVRRMAGKPRAMANQMNLAMSSVSCFKNALQKGLDFSHPLTYYNQTRQSGYARFHSSGHRTGRSTDHLRHPSWWGDAA
jgi:hypothetical protein